MSAPSAAAIAGISLAGCFAVSIGILIGAWSIYARRRRSIAQPPVHSTEYTLEQRLAANQTASVANEFDTRQSSSQWMLESSHETLPNQSNAQRQPETSDYPSKFGLPPAYPVFSRGLAPAGNFVVPSRRPRKSLVSAATYAHGLIPAPQALQSAAQSKNPQDSGTLIAKADRRQDDVNADETKHHPAIGGKLQLRRSTFGDSGLTCFTGNSIQSIAEASPFSNDNNLQSNILEAPPRLSSSGRHCRSSSLCSQSSGAVPAHSLPPLPLYSANRKGFRRSARAPSESSLASSSESASSSILLHEVGGQSKARTEFSERNPDVMLGAQLRKSDLALCDFLVTGNLGEETRLAKRRDYVRKRLNSPSTAIRKAESDCLIHPAFRRPQLSSEDDQSGDDTSISAFRASRKLRSFAPAEKSPISACKAYNNPRSTPKRRQVTQGTSETGSPSQRVLTQGVGQIANAEKEIEAGSPSGHRKQKPLPYDSDEEVVKPSVLKGSPRAKIKGHRRQNTVRILVEPTTFNYALPPSSNSTLQGKSAEMQRLDHETSLPHNVLSLPVSEDKASRERGLLSSTLSSEQVSRGHSAWKAQHSSRRSLSGTVSGERESCSSSALPKSAFTCSHASHTHDLQVDDADGRDDTSTEPRKSGRPEQDAKPSRSADSPFSLLRKSDNMTSRRPSSFKAPYNDDDTGRALEQASEERLQTARQPSCSPSVGFGAPRMKRQIPPNPMDSKPDLAPPCSPYNSTTFSAQESTESFGVQDLLESVQSLRRMDSEKVQKIIRGDSTQGEQIYMKPQWHRQPCDTWSEDSGKENLYVSDGLATATVKPLNIGSSRWTRDWTISYQ